MALKVAVIGGGAAGLMAAFAAASMGNTVTVFEKNQRPARKVMITGKGRCNVTNNCDRDTFLNNVIRGKKFLFSAFNAFSSEDTMNFFEERRVPLKTERGNRVFPVSDKAVDIVDALVNASRSMGVKIENKVVSSVLQKDGQISGITFQNGETESFDRVILATGGASYPVTGSTGDGYTIAKDLGHDIIPPKPSLVPLEVVDRSLCELQGLSLRNIGLKVKDSDSKVLYEDFGEMMFTHFGITGPTVLSASAFVRNIAGKTVELDLKPALSEEKLEDRIRRDFDMYSNKDFVNALCDLLPSKMIPVIADKCNIPHTKKINQITKEDRKKLVSVLKHFTIEIKCTRPIAEAIVTSGGVSVKQIKPSTMESKLVNGLFFAGEVIDVDAYTGGFNLQIAFSTGYMAGMNA